MALPAPGAPFLRSGVMGMSAGQVGDCLEDDRLFLEKGISEILAGRT